MALVCYEAQEQHDPEHTDKITEVLQSLQQQLNVSSNYFLQSFICVVNIFFFWVVQV